MKATAESSPARAARPGGPRVLILDDDDVRRASMARALGESYDVVSAADGTTGLEVASAMQPDVILCNLRLAGAGGVDILGALRRDPATAATPVLPLAGRPGDDAPLTPLAAAGVLLRVERELTRGQRKPGVLGPATPAVMWRTALDGAVTFLNGRFEDFTGITRTDALHYGWLQAVPTDDRAAVLAHFDTPAAAGAALNFEHRLWHAASRTYRTVRVSGEPARDARGNVDGWSGTATDVDEERRARERDRAAADAFGRASLPKVLPSVPGLDFSAEFQAAGAQSPAGGDWYDAFALTDGRIVVSVGGVTGRGSEGAVTIVAARQSIRGAAQIVPDPRAVLDAADRALRSEIPGRVATAFVGVFEPITGYLTFASAGHPPPMLRRSDESIVELRDAGLPLGLRSAIGASPEAPKAIHLEAGSLLVLYTGGSADATRERPAGESRVRSALARLAPGRRGNLAHVIRCSVLDGIPDDDVAILALAVSARPAGDTVRWTLAGTDPGVAAQMRRDVAERLRERGATEAEANDAELILGELVGNVVRHTAGAADVALDLAGEFPVVHVLDRGCGFTFTAGLPQDEMSESGRGLFITMTLARDLTVARRPDGGSHARAVLAHRLPRASVPHRDVA